MTTVAIHQPNYLPWTGYFSKMAKCDIFVLFDDVQYPMGKEFANRNRIKTPQGSLWLTVPVKNKGDMLKINEVEINNEVKWNIRHWKSIESFYQRSPFFQVYENEFENIILNTEWTKLCDLNVELIKLIKKILGIDAKLLFSSQLKAEGKGEEKILNILKLLNADKYLTTQGPGAQRYANEEDFKKSNIEIIFNEFMHPVYMQNFGDFMPDLSIIDLLFNMGDKARELI